MTPDLRALSFLVLGLALACGPAPAQDASLVRSSDPELRRVAAELLPDLARRSGLELLEPVRVERRSRSELEAYLRAKLDEELGPEEAVRVGSVYALLGLLPPDLDLRAVLLSVYLEQVAGFYDPDSTALFVMDDQPVEALQSLLVHELVHAVQDQHASLDSLTAPERGNDRQVAAQAAIEGHATLVMLEHTAEQVQGRPVDLSELPNFSQAIRPALQAMMGQYPALASAPDLLQESLLFPYLEGVSFVQALWREREGRPVPFGAELPQSTEQVLRPERFLGPEPDHPTPVTLESLDGHPVLYRNGLGQLEVEVLLETLVGPDARSRARGWDGDAYLLLDPGSGEPSLAWGAVWDDPESRDGFVTALRPVLGSLPGEASLEALDVDGRPATLLTVGPVGEVRISTDP